ncbi:MAG: hydroxymethylbilane synthase [Candidatus Limnocylindria bacterium]
MTRPESVRIGTRRSRLARAQAEIVARAIVAAGIAGRVELVEISTRGDRISAAHPGGGHAATDGQFTAELEQAVRDGRVDAAVHSYKDLPTATGPGVVVAAVPPRADPRDCLVGRFPGGLAGLPPGAVVGTGSARREAQLMAARPDLVTRPVRGNVETRIARAQAGAYDAVVLACAGLDRLGMPPSDEARLPFETMLPAPAQGALAIQVRSGDRQLRERMAEIDDPDARLASDIERALLLRLGGGCLAPLGVLAEVLGGRVRLRAAYAARDGALGRVDLEGPTADREGIVEAALRGLQSRAEAGG